MIKKNVKEEKGIIYWLILTFLLGFMSISPFYKALFNGNSTDFEGPLFGSFIWGAICLFLISVYIFNNKEAFANKGFFGLVVMIIPLSYWVSFLLEPASYHSAKVSVMISLLYTIFYLVGLLLSSRSQYSNIISNIVMFTGYLIVLFGIVNWFGFINYKDAVFNERITSVFQYPNSYAALLLGILYSSIYLIISSKNFVVKSLHSLMVLPIMISFLLTFSRGALLVAPVILIGILMLLSVRKQILMLGYLFISGLASLLILNNLTSYQGNLVKNGFNQQEFLQSLMILLLAVFINAAIIILIEWIISKKQWLNFQGIKYQLIVPGAIILLSFSVLIGVDVIKPLLPSKLQERVDSISLNQSSAFSRNTFYSDSFELSKDYPFFGTGGGGWSALYEKYQSFPYISRQAHSFYMQYINEVGYVGFVFFLVFILSIIYLYIRFFLKNNESAVSSSLIFFIVGISLLTHSVLDFDMSFVYLGILLFLCLGCMTAVSVEDSFIRLPWFDKSVVYRYCYGSLLVIGSFVLLFVSIGFYKANNLYAQTLITLNNSKNYNEISNTLDSALELQPFHPQYNLLKIDLLTQLYNQTKDEQFFEQAKETISNIKKKEANNPLILQREFAQYYNKNDLDKALSTALQGIDASVWNIGFYEKAIVVSSQLWENSRLKNDQQAMAVYWNQALKLYNQVLEKANNLTQLPQGIEVDRAFYVTPTIAYEIGKNYYIIGDYQQASQILYRGVSEKLDQPIHKFTARWYIASLLKMNTTDQNMYQKLLEKYPEEKDEINKLLSSSF